MFDGLIGHEPVLNFLQKSIESGRIAHAYLFAGPKGAGKETIARAFAQTLLGAADAAKHPDFNFISCIEDEKTGKMKREITVDQIRNLSARLSMSSLFGGRKLAIVNEADALNGEAANALLKTLEEPRGKAVLILIAKRINAILPTIRSRCQIIRFYRVSGSQIRAAMTARGAAPELAERIAADSGGIPGRACVFLENRELYAEWLKEYGLRAGLAGAPKYERVRWVESKLKGASPEELKSEMDLWRRVFYNLFHAALFSGETKRAEAAARRLARLEEAERAISLYIDPRLALGYAIL